MRTSLQTGGNFKSTTLAVPKLSIIVPVLNEADIIADTLAALAPLRQRGAEVIVADGGSRDATVDLARPAADRIIVAPRGRAAQMNAGAALARGDVLLFLHADTRLPGNADTLVLEGFKQSGRSWGRFDINIAGHSPLLAIVASAINFRSRLTGIATGDQAMFVSRDVFAEVGGFPDIALMEDVALSHTLKRVSRPLCLTAKVTTSGRRWEQHGVLRTIVLMWRLRLAYFLGAEPATLARRYGYVPRKP
jgi:rSAM/selenodomain-associated transferase 2